MITPILLIFGIAPVFLKVLFFGLIFSPVVWFIFFYPERRCITWIEIHDQSWAPEIVRNTTLDILNYYWSWCWWGSFVGQATNDIREAVRTSGAGRVLELCSGRGGGIHGLFNLLDDPNVRVTLTDLYPDPENWAELAKKNDRLDYISKPMNALNIDSELKGLRLIRGAMHHFTPEMIQRMIQDAVDKNQSFCSLDIPTDRVSQVLFWFSTVVIALACEPFLIFEHIRKGRFISAALIFFVDVVYALPGTHDAIVSSLRAYNPREFEEICSRVNGIEEFNVKAYKSSTETIVKANFFLVTPKKPTLMG